MRGPEWSQCGRSPAGQIIDHFDDENGWTRSDLQGYVSARCMTTGEDADEILSMIDAELAKAGKGI